MPDPLAHLRNEIRKLVKREGFDFVETLAAANAATDAIERLRATSPSPRRGTREDAI